ncbi:hypothetical protein IL38_23845 [Actinopolyspora erythraea]|uniref:Uncharacterized protein n=1 Tax=Actinopolyspora erythraea TaxID=414996 RepID=A0ABR4WY87_9ACTN|nr:hypothetical protein [Actinopolyspora erythraea]KGI79343.1 hypothetical protein IL38_23845 [Actinopolyspora erythraea]
MPSPTAEVRHRYRQTFAAWCYAAHDMSEHGLPGGGAERDEFERAWAELHRRQPQQAGDDDGWPGGWLHPDLLARGVQPYQAPPVFRSLDDASEAGHGSELVWTPIVRVDNFLVSLPLDDTFWENLGEEMLLNGAPGLC